MFLLTNIIYINYELFFSKSRAMPQMQVEMVQPGQTQTWGARAHPTSWLGLGAKGRGHGGEVVAGGGAA